MKTFLGFLCLSGIIKSGSEDCEGLFAADGTGWDIIRAITSLKRFQYLEYCLRFNDRYIRHKKVGPLVSIKEVFDLFIANCKAN